MNGKANDMNLSFNEQIRNIKPTLPQSNEVQNKRLLSNLSSGIRNHILSLASQTHSGNSFSCSFYICFGSVKIAPLSCTGLDTNYISVSTEKDLSVKSLWSQGRYVIQLRPKAIELRNALEANLKSSGIITSGFSVAELVYGGDITDGDYRIGWLQAGNVGFSIDEISKKQSRILSTSPYDENTLVPYGQSAIAILDVNAYHHIISNHEYRKTLFSYKANSYLYQGKTKLLFQNKNGYGSSKKIAYCVKISYAET